VRVIRVVSCRIWLIVGVWSAKFEFLSGLHHIEVFEALL